MKQARKPVVIGSHTHISFPKLGISGVPAKVDTGADASSVWASNIKERNGVLSFTLFGENSPFYSGEVIKTKNYQIRSIKNSFGNSELRYKVSLSIIIERVELRVNFSLADRSGNQFPILIGRRTLHGRFVVDVSHSRNKKAPKILVLDVKKTKSTKVFLSKISQDNRNYEIYYSDFKDLIFKTSNESTSIEVNSLRLAVDEFDFVFIKSFTGSRYNAVALANFLEMRGIPFADRAALANPVSNKLAQGILLKEIGVSIPKTINLDWSSDRAYNQAAEFVGKPFVFKDLYESKGRKNFLISKESELKEVIIANPSSNFIAQQFIANDGDYRIVLFGKRIELVINRASKNDSHLNNVSAGGSAKLVAEEVLPGKVRQDAIKAIGVMKLDIGGVDMVKDKDSSLWYCLEVQHGPQISSGAYVNEKRAAFNKFLAKKLDSV